MIALKEKERKIQEIIDKLRPFLINDGGNIEFIKLEDDIVYIDETGIQGYIYREYARALKGKKVYEKISGKKYHRINIVAGKCGDKIISPLVYEKTMDSDFFEKWFKEMFLKEEIKYLDYLYVPHPSRNQWEFIYYNKDSILELKNIFKDYEKN